MIPPCVPDCSREHLNVINSVCRPVWEMVSLVFRQPYRQPLFALNKSLLEELGTQHLCTCCFAFLAFHGGRLLWPHVESEQWEGEGRERESAVVNDAREAKTNR